MKRTLYLICVIAALAIQTGASAQAPLKLSILGDSYSTYDGWIHPDWNYSWYFDEGSQYKPKDNDVNSPDQTWWNLVAAHMGYTLEKNNSFSGATICFHGYNEVDYSDRSFVTRASDLGHPDVILVCGGTNDSWSNAPVGEYKWKRWTNDDLWFFRPAMAKMCSELRTLYPKAKIVFMLNSELREEINDSVHKVCRHYRIPCVDLHNIDKQLGHPSQAGMKAMAEQVEAVLE